MHLLLIGLNHKTATVELRERLSFDAAQIDATLPRLLSEVGLAESAILGTCNRVEIYGAVDNDPAGAARRLCRHLAARAGVHPDELAPHLYTRIDRAVAEHLFRVAAGLDSLVLGEPQILGQVKAAFEAAKEADTVQAMLTKLFLGAAEAGRKVRAETAMGEMPVSVASISVQLAERIFGDLEGRSVLVVGAGEVCSSAAAHLARRNPCELTVINRTTCRAEELAARCCGEAASWDELTDRLSLVDVVVVCTGATQPVITREMLDQARRRRAGRHLLVVDLGVPRDVEPSSQGLDGIYLFDLDDLDEISSEHLKQRRAEIPRAEAIVDRSVDRFLTWQESLEVVPTIVELRAQLEDIRKAGVQQFLSKLPGLDAQGERVLEQMTQTIVNRILHQPQIRLRQPSSTMSRLELAESLRYLFALDQQA
jgi:glutamyl-tRNA reductase